MYYCALHFEEKSKLSAKEKILSEEIAKYDDTTELKKEQRFGGNLIYCASQLG
jgi:hypothetical protein